MRRRALKTALLQMDLHFLALRRRNQISDIVGPFCNIEMTNHGDLSFVFLGEGCLYSRVFEQQKNIALRARVAILKSKLHQNLM